MKKILLVDTNFSSLPLYLKLIELGHEVHVVGSNPSDCLAKISPNYWNIDYSDINKLKKLISKEKYDFIVPGCTDKSYSSCSKISNGRYPNIDKFRINEIINNKEKLRKIANLIKIPFPKTFNSENAKYPIIIKPVDSYSGKGITLLKEKNKILLNNAIRYAVETSSNGEFIIEEFVIGQLHSHSAFIVNGKIIKDFLVEEVGTVNQFVVDTSRVVLNINKKLINIIRNSIEKLALFLGLSDGLIHTQFIKKSDGTISILEITRRCPGDLYSQLIEMSTGFPYVQYYIQPFLGSKLEKKIKRNLKLNKIIRHTATVQKEKIFNFIKFNSSLKIEKIFQLSKVGDCLLPSPISRVCILFIKADNTKEFDEIYLKTVNREILKIM